MELAQKVSSMVLSIRKKENIRVRQPLAKIQIPVLDEAYKAKIEAVKDLILSEVNVKSLDLVDESQTQIVKQLKLNFKTLGKKRVLTASNKNNFFSRAISANSLASSKLVVNGFSQITFFSDA